MNKRSICCESPSSSSYPPSSTAHKRHATAPEEEDYLPTLSSFRAQASLSSNPKIPLDLIADLILPFVVDRATWNSVCCASRELHLTGKKMTPPWPNKAFNNLGHEQVRRIAFSPSGSQLAFVIDTDPHHVIHVWDRWGKEETLLLGPRDLSCLEYSLDGELLASAGGSDSSIRLWRTESFHAASLMLTSTPRTPRQADIILRNDPAWKVRTLSFSRTDSNLLASGGGSNVGQIKLWSVKDQACIYCCRPGHSEIRSLFFAGGADSACLAVSYTGSIIRLSRAESSSTFASEIIGETSGPAEGYTPHVVFSPCGSFLATRAYSNEENGLTILALYEIETMTKTQSVVMPDFKASCFAMSPDSRQLVVGDRMGRIRLVQVDDFSIQRDLNTTRGRPSDDLIWCVAFDPTCRVVAFGCRGSKGLELLTL